MMVLKRRSRWLGDIGFGGGEARLAVGPKLLVRTMVQHRSTGVVSMSWRVQPVIFFVVTAHRNVRTHYRNFLAESTMTNPVALPTSSSSSWDTIVASAGEELVARVSKLLMV